MAINHPRFYGTTFISKLHTNEIVWKSQYFSITLHRREYKTPCSETWSPDARPAAYLDVRRVLLGITGHRTIVLKGPGFDLANPMIVNYQKLVFFNKFISPMGEAHAQWAWKLLIQETIPLRKSPTNQRQPLCVSIRDLSNQFVSEVSETPRRGTSVSYTHLTLPTRGSKCRSRWSPYH